MSHVDDGELTAYADGAYQANDPVALRIAAHLSTCGNCRTRLEQSEVLRSRASEILASATPMNVETPAFEALQAQAVTTSRKTRPAFPLAWAASIILALGLGWFGRGVYQVPSPETEMAEQGAPVGASTVEPEQPAVEELRVATGAERRSANPDQTVSSPPVGMIAGQSVGEEDMAGVGAAATAAAPTAPPPPAAAPAMTDVAEITTMAAAEVISAADAEKRGLNIPRIPDLPIARIVLHGSETVVEQILPDDKIVRLAVTAYQPPPAPEVAARAQEGARKSRAEAATAPAPADRTTANSVSRLVVIRGKQAITVTGDLPADSLRALATRIR